MKLHEAVAMAAEAHGRQLDKRGELYIAHPLRVMAKVAHLGEDFAVVAVLHDTLEDTHLTSSDLAYYGLEGDMLDAVVHLTRRGLESYQEYINRVALSNNEYALTVKKADLEDNLDPTRAFNLSSLAARYETALPIVEFALAMVKDGAIVEDDEPAPWADKEA